jgi:hypothetical protein
MSEAKVGHARRILEAMTEQAVDDAGDKIWTGKTTELVQGLGIPMAYYSQVMRILTDAGAVEQVSRGGGPKPSVWRIMDPDVDLLDSQHPTVPRRRTMEARISDQESLVGGVNVPNAVATLTGDVDYLKRRLQEHIEREHERDTKQDVG